MHSKNNIIYYSIHYAISVWNYLQFGRRLDQLNMVICDAFKKKELFMQNDLFFILYVLDECHFLTSWTVSFLVLHIYHHHFLDSHTFSTLNCLCVFFPVSKYTHKLEFLKVNEKFNNEADFLAINFKMFISHFIFFYFGLSPLLMVRTSICMYNSNFMALYHKWN